MSMNRTLLRLAATNALNNFGVSPYPTIAGNNIFDSKIEPNENVSQDAIFPIVVLYTDYDRNHFRTGQENFGKRMTTLTIEILLVSQQTNEGVIHLTSPQTDSELESAMDLIESQIFAAFSGDNEAAKAFSFLVNGYEGVISRRGASVEGGLRLCARQITMELFTPLDFVAGSVPAEIDAFLIKLGDTPDYADRAEEIRNQMTLAETQTSGEVAIRAFGLTDKSAEILVLSRDAQPVLPPNVIWTMNGLTP